MQALQSLWKCVSDKVWHVYFHYTLFTAIAMLEPKERFAFNAVFTCLASLFVYTTVAHLPRHLIAMLHFLLQQLLSDNILGQSS